MAITEGDTPDPTPWNRISMSRDDFLDMKAVVARVTSALYVMGNAGLNVVPFVTAPASDANFLNGLLDRLDDHVENITAPPSAKVKWLFQVQSKKSGSGIDGDEQWLDVDRGECARSLVAALNFDVEHGNTYRVLVHERGTAIPELSRRFSV